MQRDQCAVAPAAGFLLQALGDDAPIFCVLRRRRRLRRRPKSRRTADAARRNGREIGKSRNIMHRNFDFLNKIQIGYYSQK